jgi:hypothetical protein
VLCAGIAQAAHFHKSELARSAHVHCLLCQFASGSASLPSLAQAIKPPVPHRYRFRCVETDACPVSSELARYDARGPPAA